MAASSGSADVDQPLIEGRAAHRTSGWPDGDLCRPPVTAVGPARPPAGILFFVLNPI